MTSMLARLASTRLTLAGFGVLGIVLVGRAFSLMSAQWVLFAILCALTLNLLAALIVKPRLRKEPGLLVFHLALLALLVLAGVGRLTHFDGHVEILTGSAFSPAEVTVDSIGVLHPALLHEVAFQQGNFTVDYAPGIKRARTRSAIIYPGESGAEERTIGDDVPFVSRGYRFYSTHNKGIAVVLTWLPDNGEAMTGAVHMPAYPLFDWKQDNRWQPPGGPDIRFWLHLATPMQEDRAWTLAIDGVSGVLVVNLLGKRMELKRGEQVRLDSGVLRFEELRGWMGYRVFFDPTLPWLLVAAIAAVVGLALQFWRKPVPAPRRAAVVPFSVRSV